MPIVPAKRIHQEIDHKRAFGSVVGLMSYLLNVLYPATGIDDSKSEKK